MLGRFMSASMLVLGLAISAEAQAQSADARMGVYIAVDLGVAKVSDTDLDYSDEGGTFGGTGAQDTLATEVDLGSAVNFGGAIGYDFGMIRSDIEIDYSRNSIKGLDIRSLNGSTVTLTPGDIADFCDYAEVEGCTGTGNRVEFDGGHARQLSALANVWLDIPLGSVVTPYVGGGIGVTGFEIEDEGKATFAWQLGAGVAVQVTPGVSLTADYRYRTAKGTTFTDDEYADYSLRVGKIQTSTFSAGLRFTF
jgi:opacity protein-like surface antigen